MFRLLYYLYARRLLRDVKSGPTPGHIGIILDGNRRHGRSLGITKPRDLYDIGANVLIGGSNSTISLQPVSVEGNTGLNVAAGIGSISLRYQPQTARRRH